MTWRAMRSVLCSLLLVPCAAHAQTYVLTPSSAQEVPAQPFSLIRGARELPDGRLLVSDWIEERLAVVDFERGVVEERGRTGAGPAEFRLPAALLPFRGDSTLLVDVGNARLAVIDADGRIARTFRPHVAAAASPLGADETGRLVFIIPPWSLPQPLPGDTVEVAGWREGDAEARPVVHIHGSTRPRSGHSAGPRIPFVVFARQDAVAVAPDGRIAIVRGDAYRVEWLDGGRTTRGPAHAERPVAAGEAERTAYARRFLQASPTSGRGEDGGMGHTPASAQTDAAIAEVVRNTSFAETLPFFRPSELRVDALGNLWVGRWMRHGEPDVHDVFDRAGARIASVQLPPGRRLVAIGRAALHVVREDDTGLQTLERYPVPAKLTAR